MYVLCACIWWYIPDLFWAKGGNIYMYVLYDCIILFACTVYIVWIEVYAMQCVYCMHVLYIYTYPIITRILRMTHIKLIEICFLCAKVIQLWNFGRMDRWMSSNSCMIVYMYCMCMNCIVNSTYYIHIVTHT